MMGLIYIWWPHLYMMGLIYIIIMMGLIYIIIMMGLIYIWWASFIYDGPHLYNYYDGPHIYIIYIWWASFIYDGPHLYMMGLIYIYDGPHLYNYYDGPHLYNYYDGPHLYMMGLIMRPIIYKWGPSYIYEAFILILIQRAPHISILLHRLVRAESGCLALEELFSPRGTASWPWQGLYFLL